MTQSMTVLQLKVDKSQFNDTETVISAEVPRFVDNESHALFTHVSLSHHHPREQLVNDSELTLPLPVTTPLAEYPTQSVYVVQ